METRQTKSSFLFEEDKYRISLEIDYLDKSFTIQNNLHQQFIFNNSQNFTLCKVVMSLMVDAVVFAEKELTNIKE
jgi:hypothetical protein